VAWLSDTNILLRMAQPRAVRWHLEQRILHYAGKAVIFD
jgi:formyltetrahydrofolate hydrolase